MKIFKIHHSQIVTVDFGIGSIKDGFDILYVDRDGNVYKSADVDWDSEILVGV